jgi:hypothetical protein
MEVEPEAEAAEVAEATGPKDAQEAAVEEGAPVEEAEDALHPAVVTGAAKEVAQETNPWVEICDQHNTIMSNINPKQWEKKNRAKVMKEFLEKLVKDHGGQPDMGMSLVRAIRDSSGNVDSNIWDEPLFSDVNDEEPDAKTFDEIMVAFCNIIKNHWGKIQEALAK